MRERERGGSSQSSKELSRRARREGQERLKLQAIEGGEEFISKTETWGDLQTEAAADSLWVRGSGD